MVISDPEGLHEVAAEDDSQWQGQEDQGGIRQAATEVLTHSGALALGQGRRSAFLEQRCVRIGLRLAGAYLGYGKCKPQAASGTDNSPAGE